MSVLLHPMPPGLMPAPRRLSRWALCLAAGLSLTLAGCGGGGAQDEGGGTPPPADITVIEGAVVKGPVEGAEVCAHRPAGAGAGALLGACVRTAADGSYRLEVPAVSGLVLLQARGGSYVDETTGVRTTVAAEAVLSTLATLTGGRFTAAVTPLTTLAANATLADGSPSAAAFAAQLQTVRDTFGLPGALDLAATLPQVGVEGDAYAAALAVVSRMVADGLPLAELLSTVDPQALREAWEAAAGGGGGGGGTEPPQPEISATGTLTVTGGRRDFTPQADGFEVKVNELSVQYAFTRETVVQQGSALVTQTERVELTTDRSGQVTFVSYLDDADALALYTCFSACGVTVSAPAGTRHPVTVRFDGTALSGGRSLQGSLTGEVAGAVWHPLEMPRGTDGLVAVNGVSQTVAFSQYDRSSLSGVVSRNLSLSLMDGSTVGVSQRGDGAATVTRVTSGGAFQMCFSACRVTLTDVAGGVTVAFDATPLSEGVTLGNTLFVARTTGQVSGGEGLSVTPDESSVSAFNDTLRYTFVDTAGLSSVLVEFRGGQVVSASVNFGGKLETYQCQAGGGLGAPTCAGITLAADRRTVRLANVSLAQFTLSGFGATRSFSGELVATGY
ncbi:hypothetical protein [Ideonella livida]|uniref:Uncharacterized protein n=1 Tax=Ideonella livida TaxID=2707176 RepID=A0A7C9TIA2_9BURK|nr:hypothetical protein [Ideonella livida]NDY90978.1 hypothetical protein [Ideonella livida]